MISIKNSFNLIIVFFVVFFVGSALFYLQPVEFLGARLSQNATSQVDTTPPFLSWLTPASGAIVSAEVSLEVAAKDDNQITRVVFYIPIEEGLKQVLLTEKPYIFLWDTSVVKDGDFRLQAEAVDVTGNVSRDFRTVSVRNQK